MDTLKKYKRILANTIRSYGKMPVHRVKGSLVEARCLIDHQHQQYALLEIGWERQTFCYHAVLHFELKEGKVWILQNNTDLLIADELIEKGIRQQDIVLGFLPLEIRQQLSIT